jgi:FkbM family methyltransferase
MMAILDGVIFYLKKIKRIPAKLKSWFFPKKQKQTFDKKSYSQCGEDLIIQYVFGLRGIYQPSYLDIGANHPFFINNTALFYEKGCRGINIEANPQLATNFLVHRKEDINLNIGISDQEEELDFYIMKDNTLSTFSKDECDYMISVGKELSEIKKIPLTTISKILLQYNHGIFPDFLSLDVEGMDFQILQSIDFNKSSPKIICVEAAEYSPIGAGKRRSELIDFLVSKGYYEYANTNLNAIMVKNEFWFI